MQHLKLIGSDGDADRNMRYFDRIRLTHRALPEIDLEDVDPSTTFLGKPLSFPLIISSMTGGDHEQMRKINRNLAAAAESERVALAVGSQRVMFDEPAAARSFQLREYAPTAVLCANLGTVQFNYGFGPDHARRAVESMQADGLYLHCNPLQEAIQPEGDTRFAGLAEKIGACAEQCPVPVVIKEVGAGISPADADRLVKQGIRYIDVAGSGGTSWSRIEQQRREKKDGDDIGYLFQDWGLPTPLALRNLQPLADRVTLIASGGVRNGLDMAKALVLGASLCGIARPFLAPAMESADAVARVIRRLRRECMTALFLLGASSVEDVRGREELIMKETI